MTDRINGLYRTKDPEVVGEYHAGGITNVDVYWFLAFHGMDVGLYGSGPDDRRRYDREEYELAGRITSASNDKLHFYIYNPHTRSNAYFEAIIEDNGDRLNVRQTNDEKGIKGIFERQE